MYHLWTLKMYFMTFRIINQYTLYNKLLLIPMIIMNLILDVVNYSIYVIYFMTMILLLPIILIFYLIYSNYLHEKFLSNTYWFTFFIFSNHYILAIYDDYSIEKSKFILYFLLDIVVNLESIFLTIAVTIFIFLVFIINILMLPITFLLSITYFIYNMSDYNIDCYSFYSRASHNIFFVYTRKIIEKYKCRYYNHDINIIPVHHEIMTSILKDTILSVLSLIFIVCNMFVGIIFIPIIILFGLIHVVLFFVVSQIDDDLIHDRFFSAAVYIFLQQTINCILISNDYDINNLFYG